MNSGEIRGRLRNYATAQLSSNKQWFQLVNQTATRPNQLHIYDEIGYFGLSAADLVDQLNGTQGPVDVYINSPGGEIFDGIAIYNALSRRDTSVYIDGIAASAASFIAMAAAPGKLGMAKTGRMMIHNGMAFAAGDAAELRKLAEVLDSETANIAGIYADRTGQPAEHFLQMMADETWLGAEAAIREGLVDYVYDPRQGPLNVVWRRGDFTNADMGDGDYNGWCVRDGHWVYDPDENGDDDSTAAGDTDHSHYGPDGQLKPGVKIPPKPSIPPSQAMGNRLTNVVDNSAWDASRAWHNGATSDDPAAFYRAICAGEHNSGDPATQAHWALPYKYTPSSPPNADGVKAALAALGGARGGVQDLKDPEGSKKKLEGLMKEINPDYEPSDDLDLSGLGSFLLQTLRGGK